MSVGAPAPGIEHVLGRLRIVEARVRALVARRRAGDPEPDDPVRGLYISEDQVDQLLAGRPAIADPAVVRDELADVERRADAQERSGAVLPLRRLTGTFGLDDAAVEILLIALLPDLDARFERLYGYLHDDVTRRRASIGLALELLGRDTADPWARGLLSPEAALVGAGLVEVRDPTRPYLTRTLEVPDRVTAHLLGDNRAAPEVASLEVDVPVVRLHEAADVARAVERGIDVVYVREGPRTAGLAAGVAGLARAGWGALAVDLTRLGPDDDDASRVLRSALLEAGLRHAGMVAGPIDAAVERDPRLLDGVRLAPVPVVVVGRRGWNPSWLSTTPATVIAGALSHDVRAGLWRDLAARHVDFDPAETTVQFRLKPEQIVRAWRATRTQADAAGRPATPDDVRTGVRLQNAGRLDRLARRLTPGAGFGDLVLPPRAVALLHEIVERARHRERVLDDWGMGGRSATGRGITSLFAGESGTGKTLSAEVVAHELGLDLYVIDLSTVVDKYIGETEKNLERIFDEAGDVNGVLFFDEADALFGKRSEVTEARDRYANIEIAYLLQRMERFDGITVLATNLRANLDEAFTRRIDVLVDFPAPAEHDRLRLWELHLPATVRRAGDLDLGFLAKAFELAGGDIRNVTLAAAYAAATDGRDALTTEDLVRAVAREYRKLGRLVTASEFGPYHDLVSVGSREGIPDEHP